jgi:signal transduction histidine kinase
MLGRVECNPLDVRSLTIEDVADAAADRVRAVHPAPWTLVVEEPRVNVVGDRELVVALLEALFTNSVEYRHAGRRLVIVVRVDGSGRDAVVEVTDNGIGMESRYTDLVVEPFRRLHTRQEHPGSGLGLTVADRIAGRHGGALVVQSALGESTTIRFSLSPTAPADDSRRVSEREVER